MSAKTKSQEMFARIDVLRSRADRTVQALSVDDVQVWGPGGSPWRVTHSFTVRRDLLLEALGVSPQPKKVSKTEKPKPPREVWVIIESNGEPGVVYSRREMRKLYLSVDDPDFARYILAPRPKKRKAVR